MSDCTESTSKKQKNGGFCEELLSENDLEAVLATFCFYEYGPNAWGSAENHCRLKRLSQMLLVCYILINSQKYQPITVQKVSY